MAGESPDKSEQQKSSAEAEAVAVAGADEAAELADSAESESESEAGKGAVSGAAVPKLKIEEQGDARLRAAVAAWVASASVGDDPLGSADDTPTADTPVVADRPKPEAAAKADVKPAAEAEPSSTSEASEPAKPVEPEPEAERASKQAPALQVDKPTTALPKRGSAPRSDADDKPGPEADGGKRPELAEKAPRDSEPAAGGPAKKPMDLPTTALGTLRRVGGERPSRPADDRPSRPAESESERTSQFVPLRSADDASRRPRTALGATALSAKQEQDIERDSGKAAEQGAERTTVPKPKADPKPEAAAEPEAAVKAAAPPEPASADAQSGLPEYERTKQQPLPDPAPLDLLAQLTNTPPPPETPLRTAVRRVKIWTPLAVLLAIVFATVQALRPLPEPSLALTAEETYAFDGAKPSMPWPSEGQAVVDVEGLGSFGKRGEEKPRAIASVAKVMTAYVILRDHPLKPGTKGPLIDIDKKAADDAKLGADGESVVEVSEGDKISQREAIDAIMIASANNIARLLARWDAGSEKAFVKKMNDAAKDLGMTNTTYTDPSGLRRETVSTAVDQVKLAKKAMTDPLFRAIVRQPSYTDAKDKSHRNWNGLVPLDGVVGIKTGTTSSAGGNLVFAAEKNIGGTKQMIIGAVLGQYGVPIIDTVLAESKKLIDAAQDALISRTVVKKGDVVGEVDDGLGGTTPVVATRDVTAVGWPGLTVDLKLTDGGKAIPHEAKAGTAVGTLTVGSGPGQVKVPVALQKDLVEPDFGSKLTRIA
ncbi:D-alanyl-D-alanine carboxypeptidase [Streptomyces pathocidini]|uniref:D-alanyl-D-alanine carboxypeptidase n=1 Tax=Streptomyces pathocidini TaxID=1650571 RepID=A0ABW7USV5_9ACTN|nr:D-alanyl-D-alanine carboxypeptidase [Streptomyces pathocidini]